METVNNVDYKLKELIDNAKRYIEANNTLVGIKRFSEWRQQGIVKSIRKNDKNPFTGDRIITFKDGTSAVIWM